MTCAGFHNHWRERTNFWSGSSYPNQGIILPHGITKLRLKDKGRLTKNAGPDLPNSKVLVAQSCLTLCDPIDCSPPGSSIHGILLDQGSNSCFLNWQVNSLPLSHQGSPSIQALKLCPTLCDHMDCGMPGSSELPPSLRVCSDLCPLSQWSQRLLAPSPPAFSLSQHQGLFQWVGSLHQAAKVLELQL